ncbi:acyl-CoA-like ligand-binding transcription factor, partial [Streptomyces hygroscopicus]|uniref:acyl-CoA-like ligand-binding transcription factor n=1 Tax=Streptomyces hygroscopicus TaxID=1912 RepID=UPI00215E0067
LIVSEPATNAVRYGSVPGRLFRVQLTLTKTRLRITVSDPRGERMPRPRRPSPRDKHGRGLLIVRALAARWGVRERTVGKEIWAELDLTASPTEPWLTKKHARPAYLRGTQLSLYTHLMGLRERKKAETRAALSWAAVRLTVERGLDNVKVEDIADAVGVSPRTFNNYFSSKAEAIVFRHLDRCLGVAEALRERSAEPLWDAITHAVLTRFGPDAQSAAHPVADAAQWTAGVRVMVAEPALRGEMLRAGAIAEAEIAAAVAERTGGDLDHDLYPHLVASAVMAAVNTAIAHHLRTDPPVPVDRLLTDALARIAAGLSTP